MARAPAKASARRAGSTSWATYTNGTFRDSKAALCRAGPTEWWAGKPNKAQTLVVASMRLMARLFSTVPAHDLFPQFTTTLAITELLSSHAFLPELHRTWFTPPAPAPAVLPPPRGPITTSSTTVV